MYPNILLLTLTLTSHCIYIEYLDFNKDKKLCKDKINKKINCSILFQHGSLITNSLQPSGSNESLVYIKFG